MQQENAGLPEEQQREQNLAKLLTKVEKMGYPEAKPQVVDAFKRGLTEFSAFVEVDFGKGFLMDIALHFGKGKNGDGKVYLNEQEAVLTRPLIVPHRTVDDRKTIDVEALILTLPKTDPILGFTEAAVITADNKPVLDQINTGMTWLQEKAPHVYNALVVKYQLPTDVVSTKEQLQQQKELEIGMVRYNKVSSYFNLSKLELFHAMDGRFPLKTLFKTKGIPDAGQPRMNAAQPGDTRPEKTTSATNKRKFQAYVKMDFANKQSDGTSPIELIPANRLQIGKAMLDYNFEEMNNRQVRPDIIRFLEKGSPVILTNANKSGEKQVLVSANPEFKTMDLKTVTGAIIYDQHDYLKNPLAVEVGAVVSFKKEGERSTKPVTDTKEVLAPDQMAARFASFKQQAVEGQPSGISTGDEKKLGTNTGAGKHANGTPGKGGDQVDQRRRRHQRNLQEDKLSQGAKL